MPMHDMNDSMPMIGDRIKIVPGHEHVKGHTVGTVRQVIGGALGIEFDGMEGMIHQWYVASEVIVITAAEEPKEPGDDMEMQRGGIHPLSAADQIAALRNNGVPMGKMRQFRRAIRNSVGKPLLFDARDGYGAVLRGLFERVARGDRVHDGEIHEVMADTRSEADAGDEPKRITIAAGPTLIPGGAGGKITALVPVRGVALYDLDFQPYCFSTLLLAQTMAALANDPEVGTIVLDIDSPGGMVTGTAEAADAIYAAGKRKKVVALINPLAASAAYWLASQANEIVAIKSADVGSIGVFLVHTDCSKFNEMQGMKITYIYAGEHKVEGNSDEPLADGARAYFQSEVDTIYKDFLKAVARGRGKSVDDVFENFGKGRCMMAPMAKKVGMIDDFMTIDAALSRWGVATVPATRGRRGEDEAPPPAARVFGDVLNVSPDQVDSNLLIYQVNDGPVGSVDAVYDRGIALTRGDDHADHAILAEAVPKAGFYDTCLAEGFFRLGGVPAGAVTADVREAESEAPGRAAAATISVEPATAVPLDLSTEGCTFPFFRKVENGGDVKIFVEADWPKRTCISADLVLDHLSGTMFVEATDVRFETANGKALYRKLGETAFGDWVCALVHGTFEPLPASAPTDTDTLGEQAQTGLERLAAANAAVEAAARSRRLALLRA